MSVHKKGGTKIYLFPSKLTANPREIMKKYLLLILSIFVTISISAQCLGEDCSIKGRNKAAKKKAIKLTGSKRAGRTYSSTKKRKLGGKAFDPFSGGSSKKSNAGGFDPFEAESKRKKGKGAGGYDPFASAGKKKKGSRGSAYDPFESGKSSRKNKGGGYDPFDNDGKRKGVASGGYDPFSKGKKKLRNASSSYDGWDTGGSRRKGRGSANDSWLDDSKQKHGSNGGGFDPFASKSRRKVSNSGGGTWAMNNRPKQGGGGGNDSWDKTFSAGTAPPSYSRQDDIATSYDDFGSTSFSTDYVFNRPHYWKYTLYAGQIMKHSPKVDMQLAGGEAVRPVIGAEIAYEVPTQGDKNWHHFFNMPSYGYALTYLNLGQDERLGSAIAFYPYVDIPLFRSKVVDLNFSNGFGVSYVTKFDETSSTDSINPATNGSHLIGSPVNVFLKTGLNFNIRPVTTIRSDKDEFRSRYTINAGVSMMHMSNGSFSSPNTGINMLAANISLKHTPMAVTEVLRQRPDDLPHLITLDVMATAGLRELSVLDTRKYLVGNLNIAAYYQLHNIYRVGLGVDGFFDEVYQEKHQFIDGSKYDGFYSNSTYKDGDIINSIRGGVSLSNELVLGRTTFALDGGYYVYDNIKVDDEKMYFRAALKYRFTRNFFGALALKTHNNYAEFVTLGFGYSVLLY